MQGGRRGAGLSGPERGTREPRGSWDWRAWCWRKQPQHRSPARRQAGNDPGLLLGCAGSSARGPSASLRADPEPSGVRLRSAFGDERAQSLAVPRGVSAVLGLPGPLQAVSPASLRCTGAHSILQGPTELHPCPGQGPAAARVAELPAPRIFCEIVFIYLFI